MLVNNNLTVSVSMILCYRKHNLFCYEAKKNSIDKLNKMFKQMHIEMDCVRVLVLVLSILILKKISEIIQ